jgi:hypothetical protein
MVYVIPRPTHHQRLWDTLMLDVGICGGALLASGGHRTHNARGEQARRVNGQSGGVCSPGTLQNIGVDQSVPRFLPSPDV